MKKKQSFQKLLQYLRWERGMNLLSRWFPFSNGNERINQNIFSFCLENGENYRSLRRQREIESGELNFLLLLCEVFALHAGFFIRRVNRSSFFPITGYNFSPWNAHPRATINTAVFRNHFFILILYRTIWWLTVGIYRKGVDIPAENSSFACSSARKINRNTAWKKPGFPPSSPISFRQRS